MITKQVWKIGDCRNHLAELPQNGKVLDPFLGSGTTLQACKELNIEGYGFEINSIYEQVIKKRLNGANSLQTWANNEVVA